MFSDRGDYIGGGQPRLFDSDNAAISVSGSAAYLTVTVSGGTRGDSYRMDFAAPPGQALTTGVYDRAQSAPFRTATRPGIDIGGDGRGCNEITGRFEVRDLAVGSNGVPTRLWIVYEQHCEGGQPALFGEVRIGEPAGGAAALEPTVVRWPPADLGQSATAVPITIVAQAPTTILAATIRGDEPGDFPIRVDDCTGQRLVAGGRCQVWVRFVPSSAGPRAAVLRITHEDGSHQAMALQGFAYGGRTRVILNSQPGDFIGGGANYSYDPANARIAASGSRQHVAFSVNAADGSWWDSDFAPGSGDVLAPGRYQATRYPFNGSGAGLDVSGNSRGCNTLTGSFTVTEAAFDRDGALERFGASFEQHCEGSGPALTGTFEFRAGDTSTPAAWMTTGPLTTLPVDDNREPPVSVSPPSIAGSARQGQTLSVERGSWSNSPTGYRYQWLRCSGTGASCVAITGAEGQTYTLTEADVGSTVRVQETAVNADGAGAPATSTQTAVVTGPPVSVSPPPMSGSPTGTQSSGVTSASTVGGPDILPPGVSDYRVTNTVFVVGSGPTAAFGRAAAKRTRRGTVFKYTLSEAGTVSIVISRRVRGRRLGRKCVAPAKRLANAKKCTRIVVNATLIRASHQGANSVAFSGRIGSKALTPGIYQATLTASDPAKNTSKPQTISITIVKR